MKLILHIGTHKTATTSLQHFCVLNQNTLKSQGFLYPSNKHSAYESNFLASRMANEKYGEVIEYFINIKQKNLDGKTIIISAESFYAMSGFFKLLPQKMTIDHYWENEEKIIQKLHDILMPIFDDIQLVCYMRPQDEFAGSIYNQMVKSVRGITDSYEEFILRTLPIYDYAQHMDLWKKIFGKDNLHCFAFNDHKQNIIKHFCDHFLNDQCYAQSRHQSFKSNRRLSRDLLEFKRILNTKDADKSLRYARHIVMNNLEGLFPDQPGDQVFASSEFHANAFAGLQDKNNQIISNLPVYNAQKTPCYAGLSDEKQQAIEKQFNKEMARLSIQSELFFKRMANSVMDKSSIMRFILKPIQYLRIQWRLHVQGW